MMKLSTALNLAIKAHTGQFDKGGQPKLFHAMRVADNFVGDGFLQVVALLHDVVEDSDYTFEDMTDNGLGEVQLSILKALTHSKDETYFEYIGRVARSPGAIKIKLADLADNMNPVRMARANMNSDSMLKRYRRAVAILAPLDTGV